MNANTKKIKNSDIARQYKQLPSISDFLPWIEWSDEHNVILLEDCLSVGALLEVRDIATEAKPDVFINKLHKSITRMFSTVVPLEDENPWVLQIYVQDELSLTGLYSRLVEYVKERGNLEDIFTQKYLSIVDDHFKRMCDEAGMFIDPMSGLPFRAKIRRIRIAVYRRYKKAKNYTEVNRVDELNVTVQKLISQLQQIGLKVKRLNGRHFYNWLVRWFNPNPQKTNGSVSELLEKFPYPGKDKPFGWNPSQNVFFGKVESYQDGWIFDGVKHKALVFKDLQESIEIGVISRERNFGESSKYALFDKFPVGSIYTIQIVFESKDKVTKHLHDLEKAAVGKNLISNEPMLKWNQAICFFERLRQFIFLARVMRN